MNAKPEEGSFPKKTASPPRVVVNSGRSASYSLIFDYTNLQLLENTTQTAFNYPLRDTSELYLRDLTPAAKKMVRELNDVCGITQCKFVDASRIIIYYGEAYKRKEINPIILKVFMRALRSAGWEDIEVIHKHEISMANGKTAVIPSEARIQVSQLARACVIPG